MTSTDAYDVVVAGSGLAGLATALAAAELGLRPVVYEKADRLGGGTAVTNSLWIGCNCLAEAAGYTDRRADVLDYLRFVGGDQVDEERLVRFVDHAPEALAFFARAGVGFRLMRGLTDHYYPDAPGSMADGRSLEMEPIAESEAGPWAAHLRRPFDEPTEMTIEEQIAWGGQTHHAGWDWALIEDRRARGVHARGVALLIHFIRQLLRHGVPLHTGVGVDRLVRDAGRVTGVVTADGNEVTARRGVMLATGGYEANRLLAQRYEGLPGWQSMFPDSLTGDGLVMAAELGAAVNTVHNNLALFLGFTVPAGGGRPAFFRMAGICELLCPHTIAVDRNARRFADESYFQSVAPHLREYDTTLHASRHLPCYLVFDQQYADRFSFAGAPAGAPVPAWVSRAETPEELAATLGLDPAALAATVARFNEMAEDGVDRDHGRGKESWTLARSDSWDAGYRNPRLGTLRVPPFYGLELHPSAFASAGLAADGEGRVLDQRGAPIPGLHAAGNAAAHTEYGVGYQAGTSLASCLTFGYLSATSMARP